MLTPVTIEMPKLMPLPIKTKGIHCDDQFLTWLSASRRWELVEDWEYKYDEENTFIIPKGFVFDGASVPKKFWNILSPVGLLLIQALIHDFGYRYDYMWVKGKDGKINKKYENIGREEWDKLFCEIGEEVNGMTLVNKTATVLITLFGQCAWNHDRDTKADDLFPEGYIA